MSACIFCTIDVGVLAGTKTAYQPVTSNPGRAASASVGKSGAAGVRLADVTASARSWPCCISGIISAILLKKWAPAGHQVLQRRCGAAIRHMGQLDAGNALEQFTCEMRAGAIAGRGERDLAWVRFGVSNEILDRMRRRGVRHNENGGILHHEGDRNEVGDRIIGEFWIQIEVGRLEFSRQVHGVADGGGTSRCLGGDVAAGPTPVLDQDLLAPCSESRPAMRRAMVSAPPPAGYGTIIRTKRPGRIGVCACAAAARPSQASRKSQRRCGR